MLILKESVKESCGDKVMVHFCTFLTQHRYAHVEVHFDNLSVHVIKPSRTMNCLYAGLCDKQTSQGNVICSSAFQFASSGSLRLTRIINLCFLLACLFTSTST